MEEYRRVRVHERILSQVLFVIFNLILFISYGNVPLHEWTSGIDDAISQVNDKGEREIITPENLTTWIFEDGTFIPMAKLQGDNSYSIHTVLYSRINGHWEFYTKE